MNIYVICLYVLVIGNFYLFIYLRSTNSNSENRDSGVADIDLGPLPSLPVRSPKQHPDNSFGNSSSSQQTTPKRAALTVT